MTEPCRRRSPPGIIALTVFLDFAGFGMILPLLPFYAERYGASPLQIGILFASYSLAQAVFAPVLGRLSDRFGRRPVLMVAILANAGALGLFAVARSFPLLLVSRFASGMAAANFSIAQAYIADTTPPERRARGMGLVGAALGMGFVLGPALGGLLSLHSQVAVPIGAAGLALLNFGLVAWKLPESLPADRRQARAVQPGFLTQLSRVPRLVAGFLVLYFLVIFAFSTMEATLALYCGRIFGFGVAETSALMVGIGLVIAGVQGGLIGRLVTRYGEARLVTSGIFVMAAGLFLLPLGQNLIWLSLCGIILALGSGIHSPSLLGLVSRTTEETQQGATLGLTRSMGALARATGPVWGGWVFGAWGPSWPFFTASGVMAVALGWAWLLLGRRPAPALATPPA